MISGGFFHFICARRDHAQGTVFFGNGLYPAERPGLSYSSDIEPGYPMRGWKYLPGF